MSCPFKRCAAICKVLSDETRVRICQMLMDGEKTGCELLKDLPINQSTLSYHMKILCTADMVFGTKEGAFVRYSINPEQMEWIYNYLHSLCPVQEGPTLK